MIFPIALFSQDKLPKRIMKNHLFKSSELSDTSESIFIKKMSGNDSISIYSFCSNYVHKYWFLLLKNHNHYTILNCSDFNEEWAALDSIFSKIEVEPNYKTVSNVLWLYKLNADYHPTPPYPNLKKLKDVNGNIQKSIYPPRKLVLTKPFLFSSE